MKPPITDLEFRALAEKCQEGTATEAEIKAFDEAYELLLNRHTSWDADLMGEKAAVRNEMYEGLFDQLHDYKRKNKIFSMGRYLSAAAILIIVGISAYFFLNNVNPQDQKVAAAIVPGSNTATLTLADGRKINLTDATNGAIVEQAGIQITKSADGQLQYKVHGTEVAENQSTTYNTIATPGGGQYQVILPDGTKVWLNALSSLRFPMSFISLSERKVELTGEAYFEVEKDKAHPFKVITEGQEVQVLGTHFNINSYKDEGAIKTTLLEGSVKVLSTYTAKGMKPAEVIIKPGEQAILNKQGIAVIKKDVEQVLDWKEGDFIFQHESLKEIMNKIGRWYNVKVIYDDDVNTALTFSAQISRSKAITEILKNLESTGEVKFEIMGSTIKVRKN
ncbi:FecR family protein [Pedobacter gandavensis]|uniref:FecR family protein n=1 Tax=Pedobacter gandavensis TaxID=2679963 RepID=UPI00292D5C81|nr:FecR domain-containing protein [Pedobacter gandavensis]